MTDPPDPAAYAAAEPVGAFIFGLHHVQIAMPPGAEDEGRGFYAGVLGMTELRKPPMLEGRGGIWLRAGDLEIHLGVEAGFRPARKAHPGILAGDLDGLAARLAGHGATVDWDDNFPGFRRFYTFDTWGNRLEFMSPIVQP